MVASRSVLLKRWGVTALASIACLFAAGCTTTAQAPKPREKSAEVVANVRRGAWAGVLDLLPLLEQQSKAEFPGIAALAAQIESIEAGRTDKKAAPAVDAGRLVDHNPDFWRAYLEMAPGDPLAPLLHANLLLTAGEPARAARVAALAASFGRMEMAARKELVRAQAGAHLAMTAAGVPSSSEETLPAAPEKTGPAAEAREQAQRCWAWIIDGNAAGDDQVLTQFADATNRAGFDELAIVARSLLAGWSDGVVSIDAELTQRNLARLLPPGAADAVCEDAFAEGRQWVGLNTGAEVVAERSDGVRVHPQLEQQMLLRIAVASFWIDSGSAEGKELAGEYADRGEAWAMLLHKDEAVADLNRALELTPDDNSLRSWLAMTLSDAGDFKAADAVFAETKRRAPHDALQEQAWGNHLFKQGRFAEAAEAYHRAAKLDPAFAYAPLMADLARRRQGRAGAAPVAKEAVEKADPWGAALLGFISGKLDEKSLFKRLEARGGLRYSEEECELNFVLGELALSRGEVDEARRHLRSCLATGVTSFVEYVIARHELQRLEAKHPASKEEKTAGTGAVDDREPA